MYSHDLVRSALTLLAMASLFGPSLALAQPAGGPIAEADAAFDRGEIDAAQRGYTAALESGTLSGADLQRAYLRAGVLAMWTGDEAAASRHLGWAVTLDPDLAPPPELSPEQQRGFRAIAAEARSRAPLDVIVEPDDDAASGRAVVRVSAPSLEGLRVRVTATPTGASRPWSNMLAAGARMVVDIPDSAWGAATRADVEATLLDIYGNALRGARTVVRRVGAPEVAGGGGPSGPAIVPVGETRHDEDGGSGSDDTGLIVGITLAILAVLGGVGAAVGYYVWDVNTPVTYMLVPAQGMR